jgi:hypothetical protein
LLILEVVEGTDAPTIDAGAIGLTPLGGGVVTLPEAAVGLALRRWSLPAGTRLAPTLIVLPDLLMVEAGRITLTTGSGEDEVAHISLAATSGAVVSAESTYAVAATGTTPVSLLVVELELYDPVDSEIPPTGGGCVRRCLNPR